MKKKVISLICIEVVIIVLTFFVVGYILSLLLYNSNFTLALKDNRFLYLFLFSSIINSLLTLYLLFKSSFLRREKRVIKGQEQDLNVIGNLENSSFMSDEELNENFRNIKYKDLVNEEAIGVPIKAIEKLNNEYQITLSKMSHTLIIGTTGSGKTTSFINPSIEILSNLKSKPSMIIGDIKGELYDLHKNELEKKGYRILTLDLRNPYESTKWNPLEEAFENYSRMINLSNEVTHVDNKYFYKNKEYEEKEDVQKQVEVDKKKLLDEVYESLNDITSAICPVDSKEDPTWEKGARNFILAIELAMLEDSAIKSLNMTKERFNFFNVYQIATSNDEDCKKLMDYFNYRPSESRSRALSKQVLVGAEKTRDSYLTTVYSKLSMFADLGICNLTSKNEMDIASLQDMPTALFLEIPDEKETRHTLASLFISQAYKTLVKAARKNENLSLNKDVVFILDEFGNLPKIDKLSQMVTVGRSRRIHFFFVVQSYTQLDNVYGERVSQVVKSNCNTQVFIGTTDQKTIEEFSKRCGNMSIITRSFSSSTKDSGEFSNSAQLTQRPIIYPSELSVLNKEGDMGNAIVTIFGYKPIKSFFTPSYNLKSITFGGNKMEEKEYSEVFNEKEIKYDMSERISYGVTALGKAICPKEMIKLEKDMPKNIAISRMKASIVSTFNTYISKGYISGINLNGIHSLIMDEKFEEALRQIKRAVEILYQSPYKETIKKAHILEAMLDRLSKDIKAYYETKNNYQKEV